MWLCVAAERIVLVLCVLFSAQSSDYVWILAENPIKNGGWVVVTSQLVS